MKTVFPGSTWQYWQVPITAGGKDGVAISEPGGVEVLVDDISLTAVMPPGDVNNAGTADLRDALLALRPITMAASPDPAAADRADTAPVADSTGWRQPSPRPAGRPENSRPVPHRSNRRPEGEHHAALAVLQQAPLVAGHEPPTKAAAVKMCWAGIRRAKGVATEGKAPAVTADVHAMVAALPDTLLGCRDRAILLMGSAGAFRRSELVGLDRQDLEIGGDGVTATLRRSKTDQEGAGRKIGIPYGARPETCPVRTLLAWLDAAGIEDGPVFRSVNRDGPLQPGRLSDKAVALVVKRQADACGLDPACYSGHSLRAGLAAGAAAAGVPERAIMAQTGHRSEKMVRRYIREGSLFLENAAAAVGL